MIIGKTVNEDFMTQIISQIEETEFKNYLIIVT